MATAKTRGFQGRDLAAADSLAATAKHLCAYGAVTAGREYASVDVSERSLLEIYLPPFSAAVAAGVAAVMPAFIDIAGAPMTANAPLCKAGCAAAATSPASSSATTARSGNCSAMASPATPPRRPRSRLRRASTST